jgi:DMSO/TMAO reductase YedYZ molybdopterin-dependent catalytic subunit
MDRTLIDGAEAISRRRFLGATLLAGGTLLVDLEALAEVTPPDPVSNPFPNGRLVKVLSFAGETVLESGRLFESGLDGRLYTDLSGLTSKALITPADKFYVRTSCPDLIDYSVAWQVKVVRADGQTHMVPMEKIHSMSKDMGVQLMECSGNERGGQYGLMSACRWEGAPLTKFLKSVKAMPKEKQRICVSGFDRYSRESGTPGLVHSVMGASWIFTAEDLEASGAFLATKMNGAPLTKDHGHPVRLVVPGWYGCTCIKWVNEISIVDEKAGSTSQMKEFASRTHQDGVPELACQFKPAVIDQAAMPIRVEEWNVDGKIKYNVVGIMWGGRRLTHDLQIRFLPDETYVPVETCRQDTNATWTLWSHKWMPEVTGTYKIQLRIADDTIATKRLDRGYYTRAVHIAEL